MSHKFEIYKDKAGEYRVRFKYNSEIIWSSEGYARKLSALNLIESVKRHGPIAPVEGQGEAEGDIIRRLRDAPAPASDRIVRFNHNSKEFSDFEKAYRNLVTKIKTGNDLGSFSLEEVEIVRAEVDQLGSLKDTEKTRAAQIWQFAKGTLLWIAEKAAGAVIGKLAVIVLVALAALLGILIN